jgi:sugar phosphate isomerase/epimerase
MLLPGLVSITFRQLKPRDIVALVMQAGGASIEWGGDVHVPPGDTAQAREVSQMTADAGLTVSAYGSYYRLRPEAEEEHPFEAVLASAVELGAPIIRVWAGIESPDGVDAAGRLELADRARQIAEQAAAQHIQIAFEYHSRTLTETSGATLELMEAIVHPNVRLFWQPRNGWLVDENRIGLQQVARWIANIHCFHWWPTSKDRLALAAGESNWRAYLDIIATLEGDRHVSIEFVQGGTPEQYLADAQTLKTWLSARPDSA